MNVEVLPEGACLLHIGPYKTGSTAIQTALFDARDALAEHGVAYPGRWRRAMRPGWAVLGYTPRGRRPTPISVWEEFCAEVRAAEGDRVCVSTEDFGSAGPDRIERIVGDLGGDRVHVLAVARRLDRLLPSQWQERVKSHDTITFDAWLHRVLGGDAGDREHQRFWASHDVVAMADRWRPFVGEDRFTLVAADESDPDLIPRVFERLLGLPDGLLVLPPATNASLSANATELVRRVNELFEEEGWPDPTYHRLIQQSAVKQLTEAPRAAPEEPIPPLPGWAAARVAELSASRIEQLRAQNVRVVGDLEGLLPPSLPAGGDDVPRPEVVSVDTAVRALAAMIDSTVAEAGKGQRRRPRSSGHEPAAEEPGGRERLRALTGRIGRRVTHRVTHAVTRRTSRKRP